MASIPGYLVVIFFAGCVCADYIDDGVRSGVMWKYLREMVNQTKADTLNLPANATSIRPNITDTFSCENRTYGYYADVDNECQVFHVCLTTEGATRRNATYRWSFICPNETVFNQEVLTCTRPRDSIDCKDSPMYYDVNMDIGKAPNDTQSNSDYNNNNANNNYNTNNNYNNNPSNNYNNNYNNNYPSNNYPNNNYPNNNYNNNYPTNNYPSNNYPNNKIIANSNAQNTRTKDKKKQNNRRKQNIVVESIQIEDVDPNRTREVNEKLMPVLEEVRPVVHEVGEEYEMGRETMENSRIVSERRVKRQERKLRRGLFRFKADA